MRSRDWRDYIIVTKHSSFDFWGKNVDSKAFSVVSKQHKDEYKFGTDKTFWLYTKDGELVGRYSTESAPKWIMQIYNILVND